MLKIGTKALISAEEYTDLSIENHRLHRENEHLRQQVANLQKELEDNGNFDAHTLGAYAILHEFFEKVLSVAITTHKEHEEYFKKPARMPPNPVRTCAHSPQTD